MLIRLQSYYRYFIYPQRGFGIIMWVVIILWVIVSVGTSWRIATVLPMWEESMTGERRELERQIEVLQEHIKHNSGFSDDRGT